MRANKSTAQIAVVTFAMLSASVCSAQMPQGWSDFLKVTPGKPFHGIWPPATGESLIGSIVNAKNPGKIIAIYEGINNSTFVKDANFQFTTVSQSFVGGAFNNPKSLDVKVTFSALDSLANAVTSGKKPNLGTASTGAVAAKNAPVAKANGVKSNAAAKDTPDAATTGDSCPAADDSSAGTVTGAEFSKKVSKAALTIPSFHIVSYDLKTLTSLLSPTESPLTDAAKDYLSPHGGEWVMFQILVADSFQYQLNSNTNFGAGFFAKLATWVPGLSLKYQGCKTIVMSSTNPITFGYHLWRPDAVLTPQAAGASSLSAEQLADSAASDVDMSKELGTKKTVWVQNNR